ncbi:hypothetical protein FRC07_013461 [Ceratobasidium sp. 392]|nr:hypothetical protein FRC07_013461 [Ceratobasidium sp. 392]
MLKLDDAFVPEASPKEAMKPMTDEGASADVRKSAQNTLYTCLNSGPRLLHLFMPFVTEELWPCLPRRPNNPTPSIMISKYPAQDDAFANPAAKKDFDKYNVQSNIQVFISSTASDEAETVSSQTPTISSLIKGCKSATAASEVLEGCGSVVLSLTLTVHLLVKTPEVAKLDKKLGLAKMSAEKI